LLVIRRLCRKPKRAGKAMAIKWLLVLIDVQPCPFLEGIQLNKDQPQIKNSAWQDLRNNI
jgi:hypothetical protein